ncbi:hypothetical protein RD792_002277 [Penstemon davidsonii]|uniref:Delta(24)-sterol reductase n=1 Tax=Penstemon davidsonii TaxID=160366 RepID=A0ABR0DRA8_9LAMI|nr:hypothetical protein RD792_002277 [Penstemon davidsonii]
MNLSLIVVAELDDLTVGGLINGYGIEGSSHIYGMFSDTVVAYEIVLADGRLVRATKDNEYSDLFYAIPWSQGTVGLLVAAEIKLIPIKEYMKLTYKPVVGNLQELAQGYIDSFAPRDGDQDNPEKVPDFVETMIYTPTKAVCMTGKYASKEEAKRKGNKINSVGWWFKPWFYQHAQTALKKGEFVEFLFGWLMPPKVSLLKATQGEAIRNYYHEMHVIQDMLVPLYKVGDALEWVHREMEMYTDVGVYYAPGPVLRGEQFDGAEAVRQMENRLIENHGFQPQYTVSELNEKNFWRMFNAGLYEHCRQKCGDVGTFMSVYYKSKKGRKTEKEVQEAEQAILETPDAEAS